MLARLLTDGSRKSAEVYVVNAAGIAVTTIASNTVPKHDETGAG